MKEKHSRALTMKKFEKVWKSSTNGVYDKFGLSMTLGKTYMT